MAECGDDAEFTTVFRLDDCKFKTTGENPYFILRPGYGVVLVSDEEKSVETVLEDTKRINLDGRKNKDKGAGKVHSNGMKKRGNG